MKGAYRSLPAVVDGGARTIRSEVLGLDLRAEGGVLRLWDIATGQYLKMKSHAEATAALEEEMVARREVTTALRSAEARIAELEGRLRET